MERRILFCLSVLTIWFSICVFVFGYFLDFFSSDYFRFGPSDDLIILGISIQINTWQKYILLALYQFIDPFISVSTGDLIYPWINSSVMNPDKKELSVPKSHAWLIVNYTWTINLFKGLFSLGVSMSQIDFFIISGLSIIISGAITSYICVKEKIVQLDNVQQGNEIELTNVV